MKPNRAYFIWEYGKPPEVVIEIVSNQKGEEAERTLRDYARIRVDYVVSDRARHDPDESVSMLRCEVRHQVDYSPYAPGDLDDLTKAALADAAVLLTACHNALRNRGMNQ